MRACRHHFRHAKGCRVLTGPFHILRTTRWTAGTIALIMMLSPSVTGAASIHSAARATCGVWSIVPSPKSRTATAYLNGVSGTSDRDVWAVGSHSVQTGNNRQTLIRHWNGTVWSAV